MSSILAYCTPHPYAGGAKADKEVKAAIKKALRPAARVVAPTFSQLELFRCDRSGFRIGPEPFSVSRSTPEWCRGECTFLSAVWDPAVALALEYNMTVMAGPLLPENADQDLLALRAACLPTSPPAPLPCCPATHLKMLSEAAVDCAATNICKNETGAHPISVLGYWQCIAVRVVSATR